MVNISTWATSDVIISNEGCLPIETKTPMIPRYFTTFWNYVFHYHCFDFCLFEFHHSFPQPYIPCFGTLLLTSEGAKYTGHTEITLFSWALDFNYSAYHQFLWMKAAQMAAVALKWVAVYCNNNLQIPLVRTHYIHLVIPGNGIQISDLPTFHYHSCPTFLLSPSCY